MGILAACFTGSPNVFQRVPATRFGGSITSLGGGGGEYGSSRFIFYGSCGWNVAEKIKKIIALDLLTKEVIILKWKLSSRNCGCS